MADLITPVTHEGGDTGEYDYVETDGGKLTVETPGLIGDERLEVVIDDATRKFGEKVFDTAWTTRWWHTRCHIDPNTLTMTDGDEFAWLIAYEAGFGSIAMQITLKRVSGEYQVWAQVNTDAGLQTLSGVNMSDAPHWVEVAVDRSSGVSAEDGEIRLYYDDDLKNTVGGLDIWDVARPGLYRYGVAASGEIDAGTSGTLLLDDTAMHDEDAMIGSAEGEPFLPQLFQRHPPATLRM